MNAKRRAGVVLGAWCLSFLLTGVVSASAQVVDLKDGVERVAVELTQSVPSGRTVRIVVTDFPDLQGITSNLGRYIAERLTTRLSAQQQRFRVIERRRLAQVLTELNFGMSDLVDPVKAKELGRMLGAEAIVVGTVSDLGNTVDIDARIIEIDTSNILPGISAAISKDETVRRMMDEGRAAAAEPPRAAAAGGPPRASQPTAPTRTLGQVTDKCFKVELLDAHVAGNGVRAEIVFTGLLEGAQEYRVRGDDHTYFFDNGGKKYEASSGSSIVGAWLRLPDGVPARHWVSFGNVDGDLSAGHLFLYVEVSALGGTCDRQVSFRSIPIRR